MTSIIITILVGAAAVTSVLFTQNTQIKGSNSITTQKSQTTISASIDPHTSIIKQEASATISAQINQATQSAAKHIDAHRQKAVQQVTEQFDDAVQQVEQQKSTTPDFMHESLNHMIDNLNNSRDRAVQQLEQNLHWK